MNQAPALGNLLGAVVQELAASLGAAHLAAERTRLRMERVQASLGQLSRSLDALRWLSQALESPDAAQRSRSPAVVARALATVTQPRDCIQANFPAGLCVLAGPGVLEAVLAVLLTHARQHQSKRSSIRVSARTVEHRADCPPSLALTVSGALVWRPAPNSASSAASPHRRFSKSRRVATATPRPAASICSKASPSSSHPEICPHRMQPA